MTEDIAVTVYRDPTQFGDDTSFFLKPEKMNSTSNTRDYVKFHCFTRSSNYTAMNFEMKPHNIGIHFNVRTNARYLVSFPGKQNIYFPHKLQFPKSERP